MDWINTGINVAVGGVAGMGDQLVQNFDEKKRREAEAAGEKLSLWKQAGTYLNYGVPILAVVGAATGFLKGAWADRLILVGSQLAGRKVTYTVSKATQATPWVPRTPALAARPPAARSYDQEFQSAGAKAF